MDGWMEWEVGVTVSYQQLQSFTHILSFSSSLPVTELIHLQLNLLQAVCVCVCVCVCVLGWPGNTRLSQQGPAHKAKGSQLH